MNKRIYNALYKMDTSEDFEMLFNDIADFSFSDSKLNNEFKYVVNTPSNMLISSALLYGQLVAGFGAFICLIYSLYSSFSGNISGYLGLMLFVIMQGCYWYFNRLRINWRRLTDDTIDVFLLLQSDMCNIAEYHALFLKNHPEYKK